MSIKCYIAAPWSHKPAALEAANAFKQAGFEVTSRWIQFHGDSTDPKVLEQEAVNDIQDIDAADAMVVLQLAKSEGKSFEQGFYLRHSKNMNKIIVVSPDGTRGSVFQYLSNVYEFVTSVDEAIELAKKIWKEDE